MKTDVAFWDTSALVLLCCRQAASAEARLLARQYGRIVVWWGTRVEACSALTRLRREGALSESGFSQAMTRLSGLSRRWSELLPAESVREEAENLLLRYELRAADALQLGAALVWCRGRARGHVFVCFDRRLGEAAASSGFDVRENAGRHPK